MDGKSEARWLTAAELATKQHGVVALWQLMRLGLSRTWIEHQVRNRRFHRVFRGVYAIGHARVTAEGRWMAAVLACGPTAKLGLWSASAHWNLLETSRALIDVLVVGHRRGHKGIALHCVGHLHPGECTIRDGIPITTVPRTLLDLAAVANERQLRRATNNAVRNGWLNAQAVRELTERHRGRKGMAAFKAVTAAVNPQTHRTRSDLEDDFRALCSRRPHWPRAVSNATIEGVEVDIHFEGTRLIVELDSYDYHRTRHEFDSDRRRDAHLKTKGLEVLRVSDEWLNSDPDGVADTVDQLLVVNR